MSLLRRFPIMVITLVLLSIVGFCAAEQTVKLLFVAVTLTALSWYVTEGPRGRTLPKWVSNLLVLATSLAVVVDLLMPPNDVASVLGRFCVYLTLVKLYERRTARDHAHLMVLSLLLMIVGCLKSQALLFGVVLVLYAVVGLYVLLLYQLYAAQEGVVIARRAALGAPGGAPPAGIPRSPTIGRQFALQFRALAAGIGVVGLLMSVALFLVFPRSIGRGLLNDQLHRARTQRTSGYSDEVDLDSGTRINASRRVAFDLQLLDDDGRPFRAANPVLLRGAALDSYFYGLWRASEPFSMSAPSVMTQRGTTWSGPLVTQVFRFPEPTQTIFGLYLPVGVEADASLIYAPSIHALRTEGGKGVTDYTLRSRPFPTDAEARRLTAGRDVVPLRAAYYSDPERPGEQSVKSLAGALLRQADLAPRPPEGEARWAWNQAAAEAFRRYLRSDRFRYTLDLSDVVRGDADPIVHFLFESRRGHCEFFASALTAMCQTVGIDARLVSGYVAAEYEVETKRYVVRDSNAHAWTEVRTGRYRFTPIDPTPPGVLPPSVAEELPFRDQVWWIYRRLEGNWNTQVINFDDGTRTRLLDALDANWLARLSSFVERSQVWMERVNRRFNVGSGGYIWLGLVAAAVVIAIIAVFKAIRRNAIMRRTLRLEGVPFTDARHLRRQLGFYLDMLTALRRGGHPKPEWQPPVAFSQSLAASRPEAAELVRRICDLYYEARYARRRLAGEEMHRAAGLVRDLESALRPDGGAAERVP